MGNTASIFDCAVNPLNPMPDDGDEISDDIPLVLEDRVPLRASVLWRLQRQFYESLGMRVWTEGIVPNFVTCNAAIARSYARTIIAFLRDVHHDQLKAGSAVPQQPVYILEVGAGHGKLGFLVVEALLRFRAFLPPIPFVYVISDPVAANLDAVRSHPALADWLAAGYVDTAVYDAEAGLGPEGIRLQGSGAVLAPGRLARPCVVVCSYVLDSLRTDAIRVTRDGGVQQAVTRIVTPRRVDTKDALGHDMLGRVQIQWGYVPVSLGPGDPSPPPGSVDLLSQEPYAASPLLQGLVRAYAATQVLRDSKATVLIPIGAINLLSNLLSLTSGRMLLLVGDKGHTRVADLEGPAPPSATSAGIKLDALPANREDAPRPAQPGDPHIALHGSFSLMVNMHAVRQAVGAYGGTTLLTPAVEGFKVMAGLFGGPGGQGTTQPLHTTFPIPSCHVPVFPLPRPAGLPASPWEATRAIAQAVVREYGHGGAAQDHPAQPALPFLPAQAGTLLPGYGPRTRPPPQAKACCGDEACGSCKDGACGGDTCERKEGQATGGFSTAEDEASLLECSPSPTPSPWPRLLSSLRSFTSTFSPEDFAVLQRAVKEEVPSSPGPSLRLSLSLLRLSCHDSEVFMKVKAAVIDKGALGSPEASHAVARDMRGDTERVYSAHYMLQPGKDVFFELGRVLMGQRDYGAAVGLFRASNETCGAHHVTWHNQGLCYHYLGDSSSALHCFEAALALAPSYGEAQAWRDKMAARVTGHGQGQADGRGDSGNSHDRPDADAAGEGDALLSQPQQATGSGGPVATAMEGAGRSAYHGAQDVDEEDEDGQDSGRRPVAI